MNNIEILEEFLEQYNASYPEEKSWVAIYPKQIESIENLLENSKKIIELNYIPKSKVKEKIEEINKRIDYLDKELTEAYIQKEKLGTETELDANEQYIYNIEQERSIRHTEKYAYLKLLEEGE